MQTIKAKEAAQAAMNINRVDWVHGAAELVLNNQVQYDRSTERSKEAFISRDNVLCDIDVMPTLNKWLAQMDRQPILGRKCYLRLECTLLNALGRK